MTTGCCAVSGRSDAGASAPPSTYTSSLISVSNDGTSCFFVSLFLCVFVSLCLCSLFLCVFVLGVFVSWCLCFLVSLFRCVVVSLFRCFVVSLFLANPALESSQPVVLGSLSTREERGGGGVHLLDLPRVSRGCGVRLRAGAATGRQRGSSEGERERQRRNEIS